MADVSLEGEATTGLGTCWHHRGWCFSLPEPTHIKKLSISLNLEAQPKWIKSTWKLILIWPGPWEMLILRGMSK